jgi:hypothetical protein
MKLNWTVWGRYFEIIDLQTYVFHWISFRLAVSR